MSQSPLAIEKQFLESAREWICDGYALDVRYLATKQDGVFRIIDASLTATPLNEVEPVGFSIEVGSLVAGQEYFRSLPRDEILARLEMAAQGKISANGLDLLLLRNSNSSYYSEFPMRDSWLFDLHLQARGEKAQPSDAHVAVSIDQELRRAHLPFDGLIDLCGWLNLTDSRATGQEPAINMRVSTPVAVMLGESKLDSNKLSVILHAHPNFDASTISLAINEFPGVGLNSRQQVGHRVTWGSVKKGRRIGRLRIHLRNAASVHAVLSVGTRTAMRGWINDPNKAVNVRYLAARQFDNDLEKLRQTVLEASESRKFEKGIASLLFLLGFSPAQHIEEDAPDIIVASPKGTIALVECTLKVADFPKKVGKLVDRRNALLRTLEANKNNLRVDAFLVCSIPRAQIAAEDSLLSRQKISLITREELVEAFEQVRLPRDPDQMLDAAYARLTNEHRFSGLGG